MSDLLDRVRAAFGARFRVEREMETGGLTTAFAAQEVTSGRDVVLKVLRPEVTANLDVEQFLAAITPMRDLAHPHILSPYEAGETNGFLYYAVSHMGGVTVRDKLDTHGRAPIAQTVRIVRGVVDALAYAHGRGILHLEVRPENVLLAGGEVQLMDLGVVQAVHAARSPELAAPDSTHVEYRAPEQVSGDAVDHRTDIYQVGALAYELLTGQPPGEGGFRAIVERRSESPIALARVVERCLEVDPASRWQLADELLPHLAALEIEGGEELDRFGPYKMLRVLGKGGMGVVYLADQTEPVKRRVALKIIKLGMDTKEILARFDVERQALAVMDHPNIARVYDAGATASGRPYFVMEFVSGQPLTAYCDEHRLSTRARLQLFITVCRAVQHAHQKGIMHRDLKPSNIVVTMQEDRPVPKVIDFGLAKAIGYQLTDRTLVTEHGQLIGTPAYMSPEQAGAPQVDVDTRTDIYSLGVMLYELLVGTLPIDPTALSADGTAIRDTIRDTDPAKPSVRFHSLGDSQAVIAELRKTDPPSLQRQLKGDLDWITMKAMEKDRSRRYATANGLLRDIERHLHHEPVEARGPSASYRVGKFVQRHKVGVVGGVLVAAGLVLGLVTTTTLWMRATRAERAAEAEAETALQVSDFLEGLFAVSDPGEAQGATITARELLDKGAEEIAAGLQEQPLIQARLMAMMGRVYRGLGLYEDASRMLELALATRQAIHAEEDHLDVASSLSDVATLRRLQGKYAEADTLLTRAIGIMERTLGPDDPEVARNLTALAGVYVRQGRIEEAESLYQRALTIQETALGPDDAQVAYTLNDFAVTYSGHGKWAEAIPIVERALAIFEQVFGPDDARVGASANNLAGYYRRLGNYAAAEPLYLRALAIREKTLGPAHPDLATSLHNLANLHKDMDKYAKADSLYRRALDIWEQALRPDHPYLALGRNSLAENLVVQGHLAEARSVFEIAMTIGEKALGPNHRIVATSLHGLAAVNLEEGNLAAAEPLLRRALTILEQVLPAGHPDLTALLEDYVGLLRDTGRAAEADSLEARIQAVEGEQSRGNPNE